MNDHPADTSDEGGDPACWAHLFELDPSSEASEEPDDEDE